MSSFQPTDEKKKPDTPKEPAPGEKAGEPKDPIDFSKLDLSVESVEERISPSETNVFDK